MLIVFSWLCVPSIVGSKMLFFSGYVVSSENSKCLLSDSTVLFRFWHIKDRLNPIWLAMFCKMSSYNFPVKRTRISICWSASRAKCVDGNARPMYFPTWAFLFILGLWYNLLLIITIINYYTLFYSYLTLNFSRINREGCLKLSFGYFLKKLNVEVVNFQRHKIECFNL